MRNLKAHKKNPERSCFYGLCRSPHDIFSGSSSTSSTFSRALLPIELFMGSLSCHHVGWFATRLPMCQTWNRGSRQATSCTVPSTAPARRRDQAVHPFRDTECWTSAVFNLNESLLIRNCESVPIVYMQLSKPTTATKQQQSCVKTATNHCIQALKYTFSTKTSLD